MARKAFIGGNWKMNLNEAQAVALAKAVSDGMTKGTTADVVIFPSFCWLSEVGKILKKSATESHGVPVSLGAQDFYDKPNGAFTGEVSLSMLKDLGVGAVLVGHSERRHVIGEGEELINRKVRAALKEGFTVVLCIGEKLEQRDAGMTDAINWGQLGYGLAGVKPEEMSRVVIAYEPVWAIGTGKTATPEDAQTAHAAIRAFVTFGLFNQAIGDGLRIIYGGSMTAANAAELLAQKDIDGGLIGGASLKPQDFLTIVNAAMQ